MDRLPATYNRLMLNAFKEMDSDPFVGDVKPIKGTKASSGGE